MYLQQKMLPFLDAWTDCLKHAAKNAHIASLPEVALVRAKAALPHEPDEPWNARSGHSPAWDSWWATSTCIFVGNSGNQRVLLVAYGFEPLEIQKPKRDREDCSQDYIRLNGNDWRAMQNRTPQTQCMPLAVAMMESKAGWPNSNYFSATEMRHSALFYALFGESLEVYTEMHRLISAQHLIGRLRYHDREKDVPLEHRHRLTDPPIVELDIDWINRAAIPSDGAIGRYVYAEGMRTLPIREFTDWGDVRQCKISTEGTSEDARFISVTEKDIATLRETPQPRLAG